MSVTRIAEKAGVSIATVSRVLNNSRTVNPTIAERVRTAVADLNLDLSQRPVRRRRRNRTTQAPSTIAVVSVGQWYRLCFAAPIMSGLLGEISRVAQNQRMEILLTEMPDAGVIHQNLRRSGVDGAILLVDRTVTDEQLLAIQQQLPIVRVMGGTMAPVGVDHVTVDHSAVGYLAAHYLASQGVKDVAYLTTFSTREVSQIREHGFACAATAMGLSHQSYLMADPANPLPYYSEKAITAPTMPELVARFAANRNGRCGVFVPRDQETVDVYRLLRANNIEPGRDVVVVSCDNEEVRLSTLTPRPMSIDLNIGEIADRAVRRLALRIRERDESPVRILVMPRLSEAAE